MSDTIPFTIDRADIEAALKKALLERSRSILTKADIAKLLAPSLEGVEP